MSKYISFFSFRRGVGKSTMAVGVAAIMAQRGLRVGLIDCNLQSPSLHVFFGWNAKADDKVLNHYLQQQCPIHEAVYDVTPSTIRNPDGRIYLAPASTSTIDIGRIISEGYELSWLNEGIDAMAQDLELDMVIMDNMSGLSSLSLLSVSISDATVVLMRLDSQSYYGTGLLLNVLNELDIQDKALVVNEVPSFVNHQPITSEISDAYDTPVAAILPYHVEVQILGSRQPFPLTYPLHKLTFSLEQLADHLTDA